MAVYRRPVKRVRKVARPSQRARIQEFWEDRISVAEQYKEQWEADYQVQALEQAYYGFQRPEWWTAAGWFTINLLFSAIRVLSRNVVPKKLDVAVRLQRSYKADPQAVMQFMAQSELRKAFLQYLVDKKELSEEARMVYLNAQWAFGTIKVGYTAEMEANTNAGMPMQDSRGDYRLDSTGQLMVEPDTRVVSEDFFITSVDPECIIVDPFSGPNLDKTGRWVSEKLFKTVKEIKGDSLYTNTANLGPSSLEYAEKLYLDIDKRKIDSRWRRPVQYKEDDDDIVVLYEIYDLERDETLTIARGHDKPLRMPQKVPVGVKKHPYIFLKFFNRKGSFYPVPALFNLMGNQIEYNIRRNLMALHIKRFSRKYVWDEAKIQQTEIEKAEAAIDAVFIRGQAGGLEPVKDAPLGGEHYFDTTTLKGEFDEQSQVGKLRRGVTGAESATEAEIVEQHGREDEVDQHEVIMGMLQKATSKLHSCVEANITSEGAVSVMGPAGLQWFYFGPEDFEPIEGEYLFNIRADEAARATVMVERAQLLQFLDLIAKNPALAVFPAIMRSLTETFPLIANNEQLLQELQQMALLSLQIQASQGAKPGQKGGQKPAPTRPREVAQESRKVVAK